MKSRRWRNPSWRIWKKPKNRPTACSGYWRYGHRYACTEFGREGVAGQSLAPRTQSATGREVKRLRFDAQGFLDCHVCAFDYERSYGSRAHKFMEAHHRKPLSSLKPEGEKVHAADYALICANCHRMIHRFSPWWTVEEFREGLAINA